MIKRAFDVLPLALTVDEAAKALRVGRNTVYNLVRAGRIRSVRIGRKIRIPREALYEYLNA